MEKTNGTLTLNTLEIKIVKYALAKHTKELERMARMHQSHGRNGVADLILAEAATVVEINGRLK